MSSHFPRNVFFCPSSLAPLYSDANPFRSYSFVQSNSRTVITPYTILAISLHLFGDHTFFSSLISKAVLVVTSVGFVNKCCVSCVFGRSWVLKQRLEDYSGCGKRNVNDCHTELGKITGFMEHNASAGSSMRSSNRNSCSSTSRSSTVTTFESSSSNSVYLSQMSIGLLCFVRTRVWRGSCSSAVFVEMSQLHQLVGPLSGDQAAVSPDCG